MNVRRAGAVAALGVLGAALAAGDAAATMALRRDVAELAVASEIVLAGKVEAVRAEWNDAHTAIHTLSTVRVTAVLAKTAGAPTAAVAPGATVEVFTRGGTVGTMGMTVVGAPVLRTGDELVLFLERVGPRLGVTFWEQGRWALAPLPAGAAPPPGDPLADRLCVPGTSGATLVERGPDGAIRPAAPPAARTLRALRAEVRAARGEK